MIELAQVVTGKSGIAGAYFIGAGSRVNDLILVRSAMIHDIGIKTGISLFIRLFGIPAFGCCLWIIRSISKAISTDKLVFVYLLLYGLQTGAATIGRRNMIALPGFGFIIRYDQYPFVQNSLLVYI